MNWPEKANHKVWNGDKEYLYTNGVDAFNLAFSLCTQVLKERADVDNMSKVTANLVENNFPKGKCKERGKAIVLHAQMLIAISKMLLEEIGE